MFQLSAEEADSLRFRFGSLKRGQQPRVARNELPWVNVFIIYFNPNGVAALQTHKVTYASISLGCLHSPRLLH